MPSLYQKFRALADFAGQKSVIVDMTDDGCSVNFELTQKELRHIATCLKEHDDRASLTVAPALRGLGAEAQSVQESLAKAAPGEIVPIPSKKETMSS